MLVSSSTQNYYLHFNQVSPPSNIPPLHAGSATTSATTAAAAAAAVHIPKLNGLRANDRVYEYLQDTQEILYHGQPRKS